MVDIGLPSVIGDNVALVKQKFVFMKRKKYFKKINSWVRFWFSCPVYLCFTNFTWLLIFSKRHWIWKRQTLQDDHHFLITRDEIKLVKFGLSWAIKAVERQSFASAAAALRSAVLIKANLKLYY